MIKQRFAFALRVMCALVLLASAACRSGAQIVGVYGGIANAVPSSGSVEDFLRRTPRFARISGVTGGGAAVSYTLPLNGLFNYVFYYSPSTGAADQFLPAGTYTVEALNSKRARLTVEGTGLNYAPDYRFLTGLQVKPVNRKPGVFGALGIQGFVKDTYGNPLMVTVQLKDTAGNIVSQVQTNGSGFYSFYYTAGVDKDFIAAGNYTVRASQRLLIYDNTGINPRYRWITVADQEAAAYKPANTTNLTDTQILYFVDGAQTFVRDLQLDVDPNDYGI